MSAIVWLIIIPLALFILCVVVFIACSGPSAEPTNEEDLAELSEEQQSG